MQDPVLDPHYVCPFIFVFAEQEDKNLLVLIIHAAYPFASYSKMHEISVLFAFLSYASGKRCLRYC